MGEISSLSLGILISLHDYASQGIERIRAGLTSLSGAARNSAGSVNAEMKRIGSSITDYYHTIQSGFYVYGQMRRFLGNSVQAAMGFESQIAVVGAVSKATTEELKLLRDQSRELGRGTRYTSTQVAQSQEILIRAGSTIEETLASVPPMLNLATAEGLSLGEASRVVAQNMNRFGLEAKDAIRITNLFAEASRSSALNVENLQVAMSYGGLTARTIGMDMEEAVAWMSVLANYGFEGSRAGTSFRGVIQRLVDPKNLKKLEGIGVAVHDELGKTLSFQDIFKNLNTALQSMGNLEKASFMKSIFGQISYEAAIAMAEGAANGSEKGFEAFLNLYRANKEAAKEMSDTMLNTGMGALTMLQSAIHELRTTIGTGLMDTYQELMKRSAKLLNQIDIFLEKHPHLKKAILLIVSGVAALSAAMLVLVGYTKLIRPLLRNAFSSIFSVLPWAAALAGAAYVVYKAWEENLGGIRDLFAAFATGFDMAMGADDKGIAMVDVDVKEHLEKIGQWDKTVKIGKMFWRMQQFFTGFLDGLKDGFRQVYEAVQPVIEAIITLLENLGLLDAAAEKSADTWNNWGAKIGKITAWLIPLYLGIKTIKGIAGLAALAGGGAAVATGAAGAAGAAGAGAAVATGTAAGAGAATAGAGLLATIGTGLAAAGIGIVGGKLFADYLNNKDIEEREKNDLEALARAEERVANAKIARAKLRRLESYKYGSAWQDAKNSVEEDLPIVPIARPDIKLNTPETFKSYFFQIPQVPETALPKPVTPAVGSASNDVALPNFPQIPQVAETALPTPVAPTVGSASNDVALPNFSQVAQVPENERRMDVMKQEEIPAARVIVDKIEVQTPEQYSEFFRGVVGEGKDKPNTNVSVDVKVIPQNTPVNIDGEKLGEFMTSWITSQDIRMGVGEIE